MNKPSVTVRIEAAVIEWEALYGHRPDIVYLGLREAFTLDREFGKVVTNFNGMEVAFTGQSFGIALGRKYD